jgi:hypothetical protein
MAKGQGSEAEESRVCKDYNTMSDEGLAGEK